MTEKSAEAPRTPRTPEEWADSITDSIVARGFCTQADFAGTIRAALAAQAAQWKEALLQYEGCAYWIAAEQHSCAKCAPLRALLAEGKPGK